MQYYQDVTLISDTEVSLGFLWYKVFKQTHFALVSNKITEDVSSIAVGFPLYGRREFQLGNKLRLFAQTKEGLETLNIAKFLEQLSDYVHIKSIAEVPKDAKAVSFIRRSVRGEARIEQEMLNKIARLKARDAKWFEGVGKTLEQCIEDLSLSKPSVRSSLPFVWMESQQTKKRDPLVIAKFPLFIERIETDKPQEGVFNCYGLASCSATGAIATVPDF